MSSCQDFDWKLSEAERERDVYKKEKTNLTAENASLQMEIDFLKEEASKKSESEETSQRYEWQIQELELEFKKKEETSETLRQDLEQRIEELTSQLE